MPGFAELFKMATGYNPHGYQARLARDGLPDVVEAPTGTGKTGVILAWLWRRLYGPEPKNTPRRLVYALPQRSLAEQVAGQVARWLANLGLADQVALHVVMGGQAGQERQWRVDMHRPAIVVGTVDSLVSKALNRGYGIGRAFYPVDFALVTNGAHWVIHEVGLCRESTTTLRQLAAFSRTFTTAEPFGLTRMSATIARGLARTADNPAAGNVLSILPAERTGELATRLGAARTIRRLPAVPGDYVAIAEQVRDRYRAGELTLVVLNTVEAARSVYQWLMKSRPAKCTLLHSVFRAVERQRLIEEVTQDPRDRIVVATQVVEAGIDLDAAVLVTEVAPWPSLVRRAGRCNRTGTVDLAELYWVPPARPLPYAQADIEITAAALTGLEGAAVTGEDLLARDVAVTDEQVAVLRPADLLVLFDTAPDPSGGDLDVASYVRDAEDLDAQVAWATWTQQAGDGRPPADAKAPAQEHRCQVPLGQVAELAKAIPVWRMDHMLGQWIRVSPLARARPGEMLVISAADGGYDQETGFDLAAKGPVPGCPSLDPATMAPERTEEAYAADSASERQPQWLSLDRHSEDVRNQARKLLAVIDPVLPEDAVASAVTAAYLHDAGKAYDIWQDALCRLAPDERKQEIATGRPWAKSGSDGRLVFDGDVAFRHELASLLMLDGPLSGLLAQAPDQDLARYLVLAHHGKLRLQVRDRGDLTVLEPGQACEVNILGLQHGKTTALPAMLGQPATRLTVDLDQFQPGADPSWTSTALALRDRYGPFVLAYLEAIVRIADWRASAGMEEPGNPAKNVSGR